MENFIFGTILIIAGFVIVRMASQPPMRRSLIFDSLVFTTLIPTILIIGGLWISFKAGWYFSIIAFLIAIFTADIIRKLIWR